MMEGLGRSIKQATEIGNIKGLQLYEASQALTHQQFVDDTMLQGIPIVKEVLAYKRILCDFAMAIGMEVNLSKSTIFSLIPILLFRETSPKFWAFKGMSFLLSTWEFL